MKKAFESYLAGGEKPAESTEGPGREAFDAMFAPSEEMDEEEGDPLASALKNAGFDVDESKLTQIRSILEAKSEGEAKPLAGEETPEEESLEPGGGGGAVPAAMSKMAGRKY